MAQSQAGDVLDELDRELVGLAPVKARIRDIAALLVIDRLRMNQGLQAQTPSLHMSFTGNPGTGKTTVALRMAQILHRLGYIRKGHLVAVTRDDLVGQYVGHTAPKTREVLKKAMGGVLFIDEAYYLYRPDNERDYGQEAIEILMQVMENNRDDLVVILAGYGDRMETFFQSNPGMRSRIAHHLEFPDFAEGELLRIAEMMLEQQNYRFGPGAREVFQEYIAHRIRQPQFANARSVRNALDRARLRQASRLFASPDKELTVDDLSTIESPDIRASRVFDLAPQRHHTTDDQRKGTPMHLGRTTLSKFLIQQLEGIEGSRDLGALLIDVAAAVKTISSMAAKGALGGYLGKAGTENVQGEQQVKLDVASNDVILKSCDWGGLVAGMASEELDDPYPIPAEYPRGRFLLVFDPLDGSSNADVNVSVGTIFSILRHDRKEAPKVEDFLQKGVEQVAAGYAIYGPSTMLVVTVGKGTHGFTLDREVGNFILTHPSLRIPEDTSEFAINTSNARFWEIPVHRYVTECQDGKSGERGRDFNMRWIASMVAEVHRILVRGGVFMYPRDTRDPEKPGRLRLMYEASPISFLVEQAGGASSTGRQRLMELLPHQLHQRVPVILGSKNEVERIVRYHWEHDKGIDRRYSSPLFNERSLFRPSAN